MNAWAKLTDVASLSTTSGGRGGGGGGGAEHTEERQEQEQPAEQEQEQEQQEQQQHQQQQQGARFGYLTLDLRVPKVRRVPAGHRQGRLRTQMHSAQQAGGRRQRAVLPACLPPVCLPLPAPRAPTHGRWSKACCPRPARLVHASHPCAPAQPAPLQAPPTYNSWVLSEDMLLFHERALQQQLEQVYVALALAAATGRAFILPQVRRSQPATLPCCRKLVKHSMRSSCSTCGCGAAVGKCRRSRIHPALAHTGLVLRHLPWLMCLHASRVCLLLPRLRPVFLQLAPRPQFACCSSSPPPQFSCFCHNSDSGEPLPRCRRLDATDAQFPEARVGWRPHNPSSRSRDQGAPGTPCSRAALQPRSACQAAAWLPASNNRPASAPASCPVQTCPEEDILQPLDEFGSPGDASAGVPLTVLPHVELAKLDVPKVRAGWVAGLWPLTVLSHTPLGSPGSCRPLVALLRRPASRRSEDPARRASPPHPRVQEKTLVLRPSATLLWPTCVAPPDPHMQLPCTTDGHTEDGTPEVLVPPSLNDTHLLPFLESYQQAGVAGLRSTGGPGGCQHPPHRFVLLCCHQLVRALAPSVGARVQLRVRLNVLSRCPHSDLGSCSSTACGASTSRTWAATGTRSPAGTARVRGVRGSAGRVLRERATCAPSSPLSAPTTPPFWPALPLRPPGPAHAFDLRMRSAARPWPLPTGGGLLHINMTTGALLLLPLLLRGGFCSRCCCPAAAAAASSGSSPSSCCSWHCASQLHTATSPLRAGRTYSAEPDLKDCPGGSALRRMQGAAQPSAAAGAMA